MNRLAQYVFVVGIFVWGAYMISEINPTKPSIVAVTDTGFIPKKVYLYPGDTVTWINTGSQKHWPASDEHLTHGNYPQKSERDCLGSLFDACRGINPGEQWSFIYAFEGVWTYHDHLFPEITGTIVVSKKSRKSFYAAHINDQLLKPVSFFEKKFSTAQKALTSFNKATFRNLSDDKKENYITTLAKISPHRAWTYLKYISFEKGEQVFDGHALAHIIGEELYKKYKEKAFTACDGTFNYACYHGISGAFMKHNSKNKKSIEIFCSSTSSEEVKRRCLHGVSYHFLEKTNFDIHKALEACQIFNGQSAPHCYDGVFIEFISFLSESIQINDLWDMCKNLDNAQQERCSFFIPQLFDRVFGKYTLDEFKNICEVAPTSIQENSCKRGLLNYIPNLNN